MKPIEEQLLREAIGSAEARLTLETGTRIDVGHWWRRVPVWLCLTAEEFVLLAVGRRQFLERIPIADCTATHYNPASGELVLEPAEDLHIPRLKMPPSKALRILDLIESPHTNLNI